jgi:Icc-related predicted phosphoesterase
MKLLAFSDWVHQDIDDLIDYLENLDIQIDLLLYAGDGISNNNIGDKFNKLSKLSKYGLFAVIGNDDDALSKILINSDKIYDLHENPQELENILFIGVEGASSETGNKLGPTLLSEKEIEEHLEKYYDSDRKIILLSHSPPFNILDFGKRHSNDNIGSKSIRKFINRENVILNICGHCHSDGRNHKRIDNCLVLNIASHDDKSARSYIAIIDTEKISDNNDPIEYRLVPPTGTRRIMGIGPKYQKRLKEVGINTVDDFLNEFSNKEEHFSTINRLYKKTKIRTDILDVAYQRALSLKNKYSLLTDKIEIDSNSLILDIETDGGNHSDALLEMIGVYDPLHGLCRQFTVEHDGVDGSIVKDFVNYIGSSNYNKIYYYSQNRSDEKILKNRIKIYELDNYCLPPFEDVYHLIINKLFLPIGDYKLKTIGKYLGYKFRHPNIEGYRIPKLFLEYFQYRDPKKIEELKEYNEDDLLLLWYLIKKIMKMETNKKYSSDEINSL